MRDSIFNDIWLQVKSLRPSFLARKPHFNFITIHYFWIIGWTIVGSILLFPNGGLDYIDALFFAAGCATQSGLNPVDINTLNTYQQIVLFFIPWFTNPIVINTFVVFLRLYWFEKRFQNIAREAKRARRSIAKSFSKSKSQARDDGDLEREERGVNGRNIVVIHNGHPDVHAMEKIREENNLSTASAESDSADTDSLSEKKTPATAPVQGIRFADEVKRSDGLEDARLPARRTEAEHLAILERQRNASEGALRIPGPRDQDLGLTPEQIDDDELIRALDRRASTLSANSSNNTHSRHMSNTSHRFSASSAYDHNEQNGHADRAARRVITIEEPAKPTLAEHVTDSAAAAMHTFEPLRFRKPRVLKDDDSDTKHRLHKRSRTMTFTQSIRRTLTGGKQEADTMPYLSWQATVGRNSTFVDLDEAQREELGGIEYRALKSLALILVCYFVGFMIFGIIGHVPFILNSDYFGQIPVAAGINKVWWGIFTGSSSFTDLGFTLTPDSMISFQTAIWPLVLGSFLIVIGNTGFPIMLRFVIWVTTLYVPTGSGIWEELKFLLDHPRRCFTLLFPSKANWWLFWILIILNGLDLLFFIILDLGNPVVTSLPVNIRVLDGWYQAASTRTAGFAVVNLANLHPGIQVSYMVMMYISVLPIAISVRRTNVYEEKSLGIWGSENQEAADDQEPSYVGAHLRRQLSFDLWYIFLGLFIISIAEGDRLQSQVGDDAAFTLFAVLFEVVSAYGTVGLSLGYPSINASFSAEFNTISKLVIIAMQIRGRHRGLPYELDRAILLPSESLHLKEAEDAKLRRRPSTAGFVAENVLPLARAGTTGRQTKQQNVLSRLLHPGPSNNFRTSMDYGRDFRERSVSRGRESGLPYATTMTPSMSGGRAPSRGTFASRRGSNATKDDTRDDEDDDLSPTRQVMRRDTVA